MKKKVYPDYDAFLQAFQTSYGSPQLGKLVRSKQGRDKGQYYLILAEQDYILYLVDGRTRTITNPKKKNLCHVQIIHRVAADLVDKDGNLPSDEKIRAAITELMKEG